ncbi:iron-containing alcohol dehydrogenase [Escherichia albertii]|nr:iron-containing alcohol dehydrogenase [Escherichia albertii]
MNTFSLQTCLYSGPGSLKVLSRFTNKHIWIICDAFLARSPLIDTLRLALPDNNRLNIFSEITPDPTIQTVVKGITQMQTLRPDVVIGFGGGSALDAAKAIVWFSRQCAIEIETCVAIPTTSGTGSEVTCACVISDPEKGIKYPLFDNTLYPDIAILDPSLVISVPPAITANTGIDVLTHALEAYVSPHASDFTDALVEKAAQIVFQYLPTAVKKGDCLVTRSKMHNASTLAGMAFSQAGLGLNHAIAHQLGGQFHLPHGLANALLLTAVIRFNAGDPRAAKRYVRLAKTCRLCPDDANDSASLNALIQHIEQLKKACSIPTLANALKEKKAEWSSHIPEMVQAALADATLRTNPRAADANAITKLLEELL